MRCEVKVLELESGEVGLLGKLVADELERRVVAIDDIVVAGYGGYIGKRAENNREALRTAVLELALSALADLERKLRELPVEQVEPAAKVVV